MAGITVFTPTYNRAHLLPRVYESLCAQTSKDFIWLVVDDGSTDNTAEVIKKLAESCKDFEIQYVYKPNGGLQTGYVKAAKHLVTELAVCLDSDDRFLPTAVEKLLTLWRQSGGEQYAGIFALDCDETLEPFGGYFPSDMKTINLIDIETKRIKRSRKDHILAVRSDLYRAAKPIPTFPGELSANETYLQLQIALEREFLLLNEPVSLVEYQPGGLSKTKIKQYCDRPNNFAEERLQLLALPNAPYKFYIRHSIHYVSSCLFAKRKKFLRKSPKPVLATLCYPFGVLLCVYILYRLRKSGFRRVDGKVVPR